MTRGMRLDGRPPSPKGHGSPHGTRSRYVQHGCRCEECTEANRVYARARDRASRRPDEVLLDAYIASGEARAHVIELGRQGVGYKTVARAARVAPSTVGKMLADPARRVRRSTADKLLAVTPRSRAPMAPVGAALTWSLIEDLLRHGWTKVDIAREVHGPQARALQIGRVQVSQRNATRVAALHAQVFPGGQAAANEESRRAKLRADADDIDRFVTEMVSIIESRQAPWRRRAACSAPGIPVSIFYVARGQTDAAARKVCAGCPVKAVCRAEARATHQRHGLWGNESATQRRGAIIDEAVGA